MNARSAALVGLLTLAILYTAYLAAPVVTPIVAAFLLYALLSPIVVRLVRWHLPRPLAAVALIALLLGAAGGALYTLAEPAAVWLRSAPTSVGELGETFRERSHALADAREVSDALEQAVQGITDPELKSAPPPKVEIREPGLLETVLTRLPTVVGSILVTLVLTLFLLLSGDSLVRKLVAMGATFGARRRIVTIVRQIESEIARYLGTVTVINVVLGVAVAGAMHVAGLPNPWLWGAVAGALNFAPYLGAAVTTFVLLLAAATEFDQTSQILLPPALFLALTILEGQVITPTLLGRRLRLSRVVIFVSVLVLGWMWGLVGALMAVPIVTSVRILLANVPRLRWLGRLVAS